MLHYSKLLTYASIGIWVNYSSDEIIIEWSWIVEVNVPKV